MGWYSKEQLTSFDTTPIEGGYFLDGDLVAAKLLIDGLAGQKYPMIKFPSGAPCELWESGKPNNFIVHLFGEFDLLLNDTRDRAYQHAASLAEEVGYVVQQVGDTQLEAWGHDSTEHVLVTYDNALGRMVDVRFVRTETPPPHQPLLDRASREKLPPIYSGEKLGLNALAQVKFFTPDSNWIWYASEFDGHDQFFGLVIGDEIELGYFWLSELEAIRGPLKLPIERDRFFHPQTLKALQDQHRQERGGQ